MVSRVLVPMDHSDTSERALRYALEAHANAAITVLHVVGEPTPMMGKATSLALAEDVPMAAQEQARDIFERAEGVAETFDAEIETRVAFGNPAREILRHAAEYDTIVIGGHGGDLIGRLFVGDVAKAVFRRARIPVTIVR